ncbi:MAG TPA: methyltransferase [Anaerolineales bacterium]
MADQKDINLWAMGDLSTPWCIYVVVTLHIAEKINAGTKKIDELAKTAGCDQTALHVVMGHLVSKGILEEYAPGSFMLNVAAKQLLDPVIRLSFDLNGIGGRFAHAWETLLDYVRTGTPAYHKVFGLPFWDDLNAHPEIAADFDALIGPTGHGTPDPEFEISGGWEQVHAVVDVGGGTGAMLAELLRLRSHLTGSLVDLPRTVARSADIFKAAGVHERVTIVGQSFFEPLPAGGDIYLLRGVLNDWPDSEARLILRRCAEAASSSRLGQPAGRVIVLKGILADDAPKDLTIEMVLLGGKHRTVSEFKALAGEAGLEVFSAEQQPEGYFVVECRPV